ncbi:MAG: ABC transporter permease [Gammaproteobacteria bacterium]|uniref:ABC transporter permease n=1 Tax=Pseudomaricurvus alcaniphilus TaxID=1166482 RepID=UPI00140CE1C7|nr:ABC transporter permease [Pseudomaricurvus alcaniphilus]MBR9912189.1 ABC transporter permease [Gammaproteobacteria bacterium]NHN38747.1 ABC transporter permease [Pseudomaricurvus alcaniphilus]
MTNTIQNIPLLNLAIAFVPVLAAIAIMFKWSLAANRAVYAIGRMLAQLLLIGYFLAYIFESDSAMVIVLILAVMVAASSWIALGAAGEMRNSLFTSSFLAILIGGVFTLGLVTQGVLATDPWFLPQTMIPLAGMIFANSMNSVSLAAERLQAELNHKMDWTSARNTAFQAAMIPIINSLFAVGLVSLPGMMTGQILSGVSPLIAARYQIMVMCMVFGSAGISTAIFLVIGKSKFQLSGVR